MSKRRKVHFQLIAALVICAVLLFGILTARRAQADPSPLYTHHSKWQEVRAEGDEDGANFAAVFDITATGDEGDFASKRTTAFRIPSRLYANQYEEGISRGGAWAFIIGGGDDSTPDGETFSFDIIGYHKTNGPLQKIVIGDGILGTQAVVTLPSGTAPATANATWADTINLDATTVWPGLVVYNSGNNNAAMLVFDTTGLEFIEFIIYDADGATTQAGSLSVWGRPY